MTCKSNQSKCGFDLRESQGGTLKNSMDTNSILQMNNMFHGSNQNQLSINSSGEAKFESAKVK